MAKVAVERVRADGGSVDPFYRNKLMVARFYFQRLLPETAALIRSVAAGPTTLMELPAEAF